MHGVQAVELSSVKLSVNEIEPLINRKQSCWGRCFSNCKSLSDAQCTLYMLGTGFALLTFATVLGVTSKNEAEFISTLPLIVLTGVPGITAIVGGGLSTLAICCIDRNDEEED